ncbi:hypothetical protein Plhal304r1_c009g0037701 [Plasmopara halstedii]
MFGKPDPLIANNDGGDEHTQRSVTSSDNVGKTGAGAGFDAGELRRGFVGWIQWRLFKHNRGFHAQPLKISTCNTSAQRYWVQLPHM